MKRIRIAAAALLFSAVLAASGCGVSKEARQDRSAGIVKMNNGEFSGAVESFRAAYNKTGKLSTGFRKDVLKYLSEAEFRGGDYQGAADTYDELIRIDGGKPEYWFFRAAAEAGLGNAGGVGEGQVVLVLDRYGGDDFDLAFPLFVELERFLGVIHGDFLSYWFFRYVNDVGISKSLESIPLYGCRLAISTFYKGIAMRNLRCPNCDNSRSCRSVRGGINSSLS